MEIITEYILLIVVLFIFIGIPIIVLCYDCKKSQLQSNNIYIKLINDI